MDGENIFIYTLSTTSTADFVSLSPFLEQMFLANVLGFGIVICLLIAIALKK